MTKADRTSPHDEVAWQRNGTTADRLFRNAAELFRTKGYAGTSTRELSALLGLQKASLYHHMESKEDLLFQLCLSTLDDVARVFDEVIADGGRPLEVLHQLAVRYLKEALENVDKHATMLVEIRSLSERNRAEVIRHRDINVAAAREVIAACQAEGSLRDDLAPKYLTLALFNLLNWTIFWFSADGEFSIEAIGELLWSVFLTGATSRDSAVERPHRQSSARRTKKNRGDV